MEQSAGFPVINFGPQGTGKWRQSCGAFGSHGVPAANYEVPLQVVLAQLWAIVLVMYGILGLMIATLWLLWVIWACTTVVAFMVRRWHVVRRRQKLVNRKSRAPQASSGLMSPMLEASPLFLQVFFLVAINETSRSSS